MVLFAIPESPCKVFLTPSSIELKKRTVFLVRLIGCVGALGRHQTSFAWRLKYALAISYEDL